MRLCKEVQNNCFAIDINDIVIFSLSLCGSWYKVQIINKITDYNGILLVLTSFKGQVVVITISRWSVDKEPRIRKELE